MSEKLEKTIEEDVRELDRDIDTLSKVTFMDSLLDKQTEIRNVLDVRTNIVIGVNSALIAFFLTTFHEKLFQNPIYIAILIVLGLSLICAIIALKPPHFDTKKGQPESLFYHHYICSKGLEEYKKEIHKVLKNEKDIYDAYITETYNMTTYSNIPRKYYLYLSIRILIYGIFSVALIYGLALLLNYLQV